MPRIPAGGIQISRLPEGRVGERGARTSVELPGTSAVRVDTGRGGGDLTALGRALAQVGGDISQAAGTLAQIHQRNKQEKLNRQFTNKQTQYWVDTRELRNELRIRKGSQAEGLIEEFNSRMADIRVGLLEGVDNEELKTLTNQYIDSRMNMESDALARVELAERESMRVASQVAKKGALVDSVISPGTTLSDVLNAHREMSQADLSDPALDTEEKRIAQSKVNGNALYGAYFENLPPEEALAIFESEGMKENLSKIMNAKGFTRLSNGMEGLKVGLERDKKALAKEAEREELLSLERERTDNELNIVQQISDAEVSNGSLAGINSKLETLRETGKITEGVYRTQSKRVIKIEASQNELTLDRLELERRIEIGAPIDPKRFKKAIEARYEAKRNSWKSRNDPAQTVNFIRETRAIPASLKNEMNAALRTGTNENVMAAVIFMETLRQDKEAAPALSAFSKSERAFARQIAAMAGAGTPIDRAIEIQRKTQYEMTEAERIIIKNTTRGADFRKDNRKFLETNTEAEFDPFGPFTGEPELNDMIRAEFDILAEDYAVLTGGDMEVARNLAWTDIKNVYSPSEVNGERVMMKHAPDAAYTQFSSDEIRDRFVNDLESLGVDSDNAEIVVDPTVVQMWPNPTYPVIITSPNGEKNVLLDRQGRVQRWSPLITDKSLEAKQ